RPAGVPGARRGTHAGAPLLDPTGGTPFRHAVVDRQSGEPARLQAVSNHGHAGGAGVSRVRLGGVMNMQRSGSMVPWSCAGLSESCAWLAHIPNISDFPLDRDRSVSL